MIRLRAVRSLLVEEVGEVRAETAAEDNLAEAELEERQRAAIEKARRRAALVAALDLVAILVLFALRPRGLPFLVLEGTEQGLFTLAVVVVAVHAGFRLGQRQKLGAVRRALDSLPEEGDQQA